jgi:hypothetical protein
LAECNDNVLDRFKKMVNIKEASNEIISKKIIFVTVHDAVKQALYEH